MQTRSRLVAVSIAASALFPSLAISQKSTLHPDQATERGNSMTSLPFGYRPSHYQQVLDWRGFRRKDGFLFRNLRFRMSEVAANGRFGGQRVQIAVHMALTPRGIGPHNASEDFARNVDTATLKTVVVPRWIDLPKLRSTAFGFEIPFDASKRFAYSAMSRRNLVIQIRVFSNSVGNGVFLYPMDAYRGVTSGSVSRSGSFNGCRNAITRVIPTHTADAATLHLGNPTHKAVGTCRRSGTPAFLIFGPSPVTGISIGACALGTTATLLLPAVSRGANGTVEFPLPIPNDSRFRGARFYTQIWWYQNGASPTGLFATPTLRQSISTEPATLMATRVYADGPFATRGIVTRGFGLVIGFDG